MSTEYRESEPFTQSLVGPLVAWRRHWVKGVVAALLGAAIGAAAGLAVPVSYTAESRVAVGAGDLTSGAVAGFPAAASSLAANYARYVNDRGVAETDVPEGVTLSASQIPESNVIRIEAVSNDTSAATSAANTAADQLVAIVNTSGRQNTDEAFKEYTKAAAADAKAQTNLATAQHKLDVLLGKKKPSSAALKKARAAVTAATTTASGTGAKSGALRQKYSELVAGWTTTANLLVIRTADDLTSNRVSLVSRTGLLGLLVGAVAGLLLAVNAERKRGNTADQRAPREGTQPKQ